MIPRCPDRRRLHAALALLTAGLVGMTSAGYGSSPVVWEHPARPAEPISGREGKGALQAPLLPDKGGERADGVSVGESGLLRLSIPVREIFPGSSKITAPAILWTASLDMGGTLYVGAGNTGEVFRIDRKGTTVSHLDTEELGVRALASSVTGDLFVATFPNGSVYRVRPGGKMDLWLDLQDRYVWAMAVDAAERLYVATGERGMLYRVAGQGDAASLYDSDEANLTSLVLERGGNLLAGTAPGGLLYRISQDGRAEVILDTGLAEVSAVTVTPEGIIYAAAIGEEQIPATRKPGEKSDLTIEVTPAPDGGVLEDAEDLPRKITIDLAELLPSPESAVAGAAGRIYRIEPGRAPALVWKSDVERVYALAYTKMHGLLVGTGGRGVQGRVHRLEEDGSATMLRQFPEPQVTCLLASPDGRAYACTSNPGRVYLLDSGSIQSGSYLSSIHDAGHTARWGTMSWEVETPAGTRIELSTRSGNRLSPDSTWSDWSPPYALEKGSAISSPPGRYLQWKAELSRLKTDATPTLKRIRVTLLPDNRAPQVGGLRVLQPSEASWKPLPQEAEASQPEPKRSEKAPPQKGSRWVIWSSTDPDGDDLSHTIWLKRSEEEAFRVVAKGVDSTPYALEDADLPEGSYVLKIEADDAATNGDERALRDQQISPTFVVDHTPPQLEAGPPTASSPGAGGLTVEVTAMDAAGWIARGEYSLEGDAGQPAAAAAPVWKSLPCRDRICDTSIEKFLVELPDPAAAKQIVIRVLDAAGNSATLGLPGARRSGDD